MSGEAKQKTVSLIFLPPPQKLRWAGLIFYLFLLCTASCNTVDPPPDKTVLTLTLEDVSCTEAWITLTTNNLQLPTTLNLIKDNTITKTIDLQTADTLLYIDSLLPNTSYQYQVTSIQSATGGPATSNELSVTTMDTTSHDFTFQTWTFGTIGSSSLYDVAIISENNIWCVGEILVADSSPNGYTMYNAVHWDGIEWELKRIPYYYNGQTFYNGIRAIFAFNENDIWFGTGNMTHWNGTQFLSIYLGIGMYINKIWGSSSNDLYVVGNSGKIAHYNGTSWQLIESGTNANIVDISGIQNDAGKYIKYCAADNLLLKIDGDNNLTSIAVEQGMFLNSVWAASNRLVYTAGNGIVLYRNKSWQTFYAPEINTIYRIKGQSYNDIVGLSANLSIFHFNGYSWNTIQTGLNNIYLKLQIKNNIIATVGWQNDRALITLLFRN